MHGHASPHVDIPVVSHDAHNSVHHPVHDPITDFHHPVLLHGHQVHHPIQDPIGDDYHRPVQSYAHQVHGSVIHPLEPPFRHLEHTSTEDYYPFPIMTTTVSTLPPARVSFPDLVRQERRPSFFERINNRMNFDRINLDRIKFNRIKNFFRRTRHGTDAPRQRPFVHRREGAHQDFGPRRRAFDVPRTNGPVWRDGMNPLTGDPLFGWSGSEQDPPPPYSPPPPPYVLEQSTDRNNVSSYLVVETDGPTRFSFTTIRSANYEGGDEMGERVP